MDQLVTGLAKQASTGQVAAGLEQQLSPREVKQLHQAVSHPALEFTLATSAKEAAARAAFARAMGCSLYCPGPGEELDTCSWNWNGACSSSHVRKERHVVSSMQIGLEGLTSRSQDVSGFHY